MEARAGYWTGLGCNVLSMFIHIEMRSDEDIDK